MQVQLILIFLVKLDVRIMTELVLRIELAS
jgi:hypothetical protein